MGEKLYRVTIEVDGRPIEVCTATKSARRPPWMFWSCVRPVDGELLLPPIFKVTPEPS